MLSTKRTIFYILTSIITTLLAWQIGNLLIDILEAVDFAPAFCEVIYDRYGWVGSTGLQRSFCTNLDIFSTSLRSVSPPPYTILLTTLVPIISVGTITAEIFLNNPTRGEINRRILFRHLLKVALLLGLIAGLSLSLLNWLLLKSDFTPDSIRVISWSMIGLFAGAAEGLSWASYSIEGSKRRIRQRVFQSTLLGAISGLVAWIIFGRLRPILVPYDEPFGFLLLGAFLGTFLCFAARPSYHAALRAGQGFEVFQPRTKVNPTFYEDEVSPRRIRTRRPTLNNKQLKLIPDNDGTHQFIEEGLSIQLPTKTQKPFRIGSSDKADIYIPHLPEDCALLLIRNGSVEIKCLSEGSIQIQRRFIAEGRGKTLSHNQIITLYHEDNPDKFYRFVFYNRFLDPQA